MSPKNPDVFCTFSKNVEENECSNGICQTNFCDCGIRGFGNRCYYSTTQKSFIQPYLIFAIKELDSIIKTKYETDLPDELNFKFMKKLLLFFSDLSL